MHHDPHTVTQLAAALWVATMAALLFVAPALGLPAPREPLEVLAAGVGLALLLGGVADAAWRADGQSPYE